MDGQAPARSVYLLVDASGSTVRDGFNLGCNQALPAVVSALEELGGPDTRLAVHSYATTATVRVPLTRARDIAILPAMPATGLSSLAAGLRLLAETMCADHAQLVADGLDPGVPAVVVVADGLPTDEAADVIAARAMLDVAVLGPPEVRVVTPYVVDALAVAGLGAIRHAIGPDGDVVSGIVSAVLAMYPARGSGTGP